MATYINKTTGEKQTYHDVDLWLDLKDLEGHRHCLRIKVDRLFIASTIMFKMKDWLADLGFMVDYTTCKNIADFLYSWCAEFDTNNNNNNKNKNNK